MNCVGCNKLLDINFIASPTQSGYFDTYCESCYETYLMGAYSSMVKPEPTMFVGPKCECGNKGNPIGQGHSNWCDMFRKDF